MKIFKTQSSNALSGTVKVPGDKSISHRSIILSSLADGESHITGFLPGEDCLATITAFRQLGVKIDGPNSGEVIVHGVGLHGLNAPNEDLDMGNSGTAMRLMAGLLSAQAFTSRLVGDASLSRRPMARIMKPLATMGARITAAEGDTPPLVIHGNPKLVGAHYQMPIASAQVKSSLLLAGLFIEDETVIVEPEVCRDHSERMLKAFGVAIETAHNTIRMRGGQSLKAQKITVPGDISSAAFFMVVASITPGSHLVLQQVGINPTRIGVINILRAMGADIRVLNQRESGGEPVADIEIHSAPLQGIEISAEQVPLAIDEFPIIFIAAACANGQTTLRNAHELRVKESDRLHAMALGLAKLGIDVTELEDGILIQGGRFKSGEVDSFGDHRIAMAFACAGQVAEGGVKILDCENVATSFPNFVDLAQQIGMNIAVETSHE